MEFMLSMEHATDVPSMLNSKSKILICLLSMFSYHSHGRAVFNFTETSLMIHHIWKRRQLLFRWVFDNWFQRFILYILIVPCFSVLQGREKLGVHAWEYKEGRPQNSEWRYVMSMVITKSRDCLLRFTRSGWCLDTGKSAFRVFVIWLLHLNLVCLIWLLYNHMY